MFLIIITLLVTTNYALGTCTTGCQEPTLIYDALKCKPVFNSPEDCCPSKYDCSHFGNPAEEEKCYFNGKRYSIGERVDNDDIQPNCEGYCSCAQYVQYPTKRMTFQCADTACMEWSDDFRPKKGCHLKYELNKCCHVGEICPPHKIKCHVGNDIYREGQRFYAPNVKCTQCICKEGFHGKFEAPFCAKKKCADEIRHQDEVYGFWAPSYLSLNDCCPHSWISPDQNDDIVSAGNTKTDARCKFGSKTLHVGDKFERTSRKGGKLACKCRIPPYVTCIQNREYEQIRSMDK